MRLNEDEWLILNNLAERAGMSLSGIVMASLLNTRIIRYEMDSVAIMRPLLGLQRHYNSIRHWMIKNDYKNPILKEEYKLEIETLWQLLAQAKVPLAQREV